MKKSGVIFIATKLKSPGWKTLLSLVVFSCLVFFTFQKFVIKDSHKAMAQYSQNVVTMQNLQFIPSQITIPAGETITWNNQDSVPHTVTLDNGSWDSGVVQPGHSVSTMFPTQGTYTYHCRIHPFMHGNIVVTNALSPTTPSNPYLPQGQIPQPYNYSSGPVSIPARTAARTVRQSQHQSQSVTVNSSTASMSIEQSQSQSQSIGDP